MLVAIIKKGNWIRAYNKYKLLGKLKLLDTCEPAAYISHLNVKSNYRNIGIGTDLIQTAINDAKDLGGTAISLHCAVSNTAAIRFYFRHGFFIVATTTTRGLSFETGLVERHYLLAKKIS